MKKNGFTLIELLAVIVILAVIIVIAVPNVIGISNRVRENMFCSKVNDIESAAKLYGEDNIDDVELNNNSLSIAVKDLIENNLYKKEKDNCTYNSAENPCVTDPRDNSSMDTKTIIISKKNKRITADYQYNSDADKAICNNK